MALLFSYGTLQDEAVQMSIFGRLLRGQPDELVGFEQSLRLIEDPKFVTSSGQAYHRIVRLTARSDNRIKGTVFEVSDAELAQADEYEPAGYTRMATVLASGRQAWVYADAPNQATVSLASTTTDVWKDAAAYESYVGRWSRAVAVRFLRWLSLPPGGTWLDFGCGSGALAQTILRDADPRRVVGCDQSSGYVRHASEQTNDRRAHFAVASLDDLPTVDGGFDACVSGLVLNFLPAPADGVTALAARARRGGTVAAYVWDYAEGMQLMRAFWDAAVALDPAARPLDEAVRFPLCRPDALHRVFEGAGLRDVESRPIDVPTVFANVEDYWQPFLGGQGPAPGYVAGLGGAHRERLRLEIQARLPADADGRIHLTARAWAIRGTV